MDAALCRSHTLTPAREGFNDIFPTTADMQRLIKDPVAYCYEHEDGLRSTMLLMAGLVKDFNFAARMDDNKIFSTQMYLPMPDGRTTLANFFSPLVNNMEQMFLTGKADVSRGADASDNRPDRGRCGKPLPEAEKAGHAAPPHQVPAQPAVDFLENVDEAHAVVGSIYKYLSPRAAHR